MAQESFQDMMARKTLEAVSAQLPELLDATVRNAQNVGLERLQDVIRGVDALPPEIRDRAVRELETAKTETVPPTVIVEAPIDTSRPTKQDATVRGWRTFVQSFAGILVVAFGDEFLKAFSPDSGFDMYALASWQNLGAAGASAAVAAGIAFVMRYWTPRGT